MKRIEQTFKARGKTYRIREAGVADVEAIRRLFDVIYDGNYPLAFGQSSEILQSELQDPDHYLWLVAEVGTDLIGTMMFGIDPGNRMSKVGGGAVLPEHRQSGFASKMLNLGIRYLTKTVQSVDVLYGTSRMMGEGPSRLVADAGFHRVGVFPNAVQIEEMEHLSLDVFLTDRALKKRRKQPYLFKPFYDIYKVTASQLHLEKANLVTERAPLQLSGEKIAFQMTVDEKEVGEKFRLYSKQYRISNNFFPFHQPNRLLTSTDGGTDVFLWHGGVGKQASILGFRTDRVNIHDMLDSVALTLQRTGAAYVELLVDAYDYMSQQGAYTARYIPSAYFPAMRLANDGLRDDYFVVNRTFQLLDFRKSTVTSDGYPYLAAYMRFYKDLYLKPLRRPNIRKSTRPRRTL